MDFRQFVNIAKRDLACAGGGIGRRRIITSAARKRRYSRPAHVL